MTAKEIYEGLSDELRDELYFVKYADVGRSKRAVSGSRLRLLQRKGLVTRPRIQDRWWGDWQRTPFGEQVAAFDPREAT